MVIKPLIDNATKTQTVTGVKKAYSTLSGAYNSLIAEYDDIESAIQSTGYNGYYHYVIISLLSKMNVAKDCGGNEAKATGCFPNKQYKYLTGTTYYPDIFTSYKTAITADGMAWASSEADCNQNVAATGDYSNPLSALCGRIFVDINGPNKGPAQFGRDLFLFNVTKTGVYPSGAYYDKWIYSTDCKTSAAGESCAAKILKENAVNY
jgi:hypothetical protein